MTFSMPGLIGAGVGLLLALGAYVAVVPLLQRSGTDGGPNPNLAAIRAVLLADFVVLAAVGYYVGQLLG